MDARAFDANVRAACTFLYDESQIAAAIINVSSLRVSEVFNAVALDREATYASVFREGLRLSHYNVLLQDYAYFQYSWESEEAWRLAYYPNPWLSGVPRALEHQAALVDLLQAGDLSYEDMTELLSEVPYYGSIPFIRFEYSHAQYRPVAHPAAHFHIGSFGEDRWASGRKLSPLSFSMLVLRMYYPEKWNPFSSAHNPEADPCWEGKLNRSLTNDGASLLFEQEEHQSLHFAANA